MRSELGKFLMVLRLQNNEQLKDMANKIKYDASYLSTIEHGHNIPQRKFVDDIIAKYNLSDDKKIELENIYSKLANSVTIYVKDDKVRKLACIFAVKINSLTDTQVNSVTNILEKQI